MRKVCTWKPVFFIWVNESQPGRLVQVVLVYMFEKETKMFLLLVLILAETANKSLESHSVEPIDFSEPLQLTTTFNYVQTLLSLLLFPSSTLRTGNGQVATSFHWIHGCKSELREDDKRKRRKRRTHHVKTVEREFVLLFIPSFPLSFNLTAPVCFDSRRNLWTATFQLSLEMNRLSITVLSPSPLLLQSSAFMTGIRHTNALAIPFLLSHSPPLLPHLNNQF